jgi:hypothetical protein
MARRSIIALARFVALTLAVFVALIVGLFLLRVAIGPALMYLALRSDILPVSKTENFATLYTIDIGPWWGTTILIVLLLFSAAIAYAILDRR